MSGVEVILEDFKNHPCCPHGPTLLFSRIINEVPRRFFACAACRDRKDCSFFLWEDDMGKVSEVKLKARENEIQKFVEGVNHKKLFSNLKKVRQAPINDRLYCFTCSLFVVPKCENNHSNHATISNITDYSVNHPSEFLQPLDCPKNEAQYFFSTTAVETIINVLRKIKLNNVICVGAPRIHEYILNNQPDMKTLLLDIDKRYLNFYGPDQFCWYNSFNHHFFIPESQHAFNKFLQVNNGESLVMITDPPFGGRIEPLAHTIKIIERQYHLLNNFKRDLPIFFIFPYFMEPQILNSLPDFKMLDYKVDYTNHPLFQEGSRGRKFGSPVRIFTNIDPSLIVLPTSQGYKHCEICNRWVYSGNRHCMSCNACTSKDGRTYNHCNICERCVKPTWKHCDVCNSCKQPDHVCGEIAFTKQCFHCKEPGHKKKDCPKVDHELLSAKRKMGISSKKRKKRQKK